jgi:hypothetical protein
MKGRGRGLYSDPGTPADRLRNRSTALIAEVVSFLAVPGSELDFCTFHETV